MPDTVLRKHYMLTMRLDLSCVDTAHFQSLSQRLPEADVVVSNLHREQAIRSEAVSQAYWVHNACRKQQPPTEIRQEPIAFDKGVTSVILGENASPELYFVAMHQREIIGVCMLERCANKPGVLISGFTGVTKASRNLPQNGKDRLYGERVPIEIDENVEKDWSRIRARPEKKAVKSIWTSA